jgi:hypothetical protein
VADNKKISVREFRMWLQGVEEMQEDGWTPSTQQWSRIREKIDLIEDSVAAPPAMPLPPPTYASPNVRAPGLAVIPPESNFPPVPAGPSNLMVPPAPPNNPLFGGAGGGQMKTPDIDTSIKGYESGFV